MVSPDALNLLEGVMSFMEKRYEGSLHMVGMDWVAGKAVCLVYCTCTNNIVCGGLDEGGVARCNICGAEKPLKLLWLSWHNLPDENMVKPYGRKMESLHERLLAGVEAELQQLQRARGILIDEERKKAVRPILIRLARLRWLIKQMLEAEKIKEATKEK